MTERRLEVTQAGAEAYADGVMAELRSDNSVIGIADLIVNAFVAGALAQPAEIIEALQETADTEPRNEAGRFTAEPFDPYGMLDTKHPYEDLSQTTDAKPEKSAAAYEADVAQRLRYENRMLRRDLELAYERIKQQAELLSKKAETNIDAGFHRLRLLCAALRHDSKAEVSIKANHQNQLRLQIGAWWQCFDLMSVASRSDDSLDKWLRPQLPPF